MGTEKTKEPIFGNSKLVFGFVAGGMLANAYGNYVVFYAREAAGRSVGSPYGVGYIVGGMIGAALMPLGIGWVAYWISGRGRTAARITACVVATMACFGGLAAARNARNFERSQADQAVTAEMNAAIQEQADAVRSGDVDKMAAAAQRTNAAMSKAVVGGTDTAKVLLDIVQVRAGELNALVQQAAEKLTKIGSLGSIDPATMKTKAAVEARLAMVDAAQQQAVHYRKVLTAYPDAIRTDLTAAGVPEPEIAEFFKSFSRNARVREVQLDLAEANVQLCGSMHVMLTLLNDNWGKWSVSPKGVLMFGVGLPDGTVKRYNDAADLLNTQLANETRLVNELADRLAAMKTVPPAPK